MGRKVKLIKFNDRKIVRFICKDMKGGGGGTLFFNFILGTSDSPNTALDQFLQKHMIK